MPTDATPLPVELLVASVLALVGLAVFLGWRRPVGDAPGVPAYPVYLVAVMLVTLVIALISLGSAATALVEQGLGPAGGRDAPIGPGARSIAPSTGPSATARLAGSAVTALVAGAIFAFHRRRFGAARAVDERATPARSAYRAYLYAVCLAAVVVAATAGGRAALGVAQAVDPGDTAPVPTRPVRPDAPVPPGRGTSSPAADQARDAGIAQALGGGVLAALAFGVFAYHWRQTGSPDAADGPATPPGEREGRADAGDQGTPDG